MANQRPPKAKKHITLSASLLETLEQEAAAESVTVSDVIESHLHAHYQESDVRGRLQRLEHIVQDFRMSVLPVVAKVAALIQQFEREQMPQQNTAEEPPVKVANFHEIYGDGFDRRP